MLDVLLSTLLPSGRATVSRVGEKVGLLPAPAGVSPAL